MIRYRLISILIGAGLDSLIGDPQWMPHPVRLMGALISALEKLLRTPYGSADLGAGKTPAQGRRLDSGTPVQGSCCNHIRALDDDPDYMGTAHKTLRAAPRGGGCRGIYWRYMKR